MACHELRSCPRCAQSFECKPGSITECQCFGLEFTEAEKTFIAGFSNDCLCRNCLMDLKQEYRYQATRERLIRMQEIMRGK
jgi:hypothetical protein